jgi:carboxyl-terminal processing protease
MAADPVPDPATSPAVEGAPAGGEGARDTRAVGEGAGDTLAGRSRIGPPRTGALVVALAIVAVLAGSALFVSGWTLGRQAALTPGTPATEAEEFQAFWDAYRAVTERYAGGEVDRKVLIEGAIKGMIGALGDPYSSYLTSEEFKDSLRSLSGEFEGIGATIGTVDATGSTTACTELGPECRLAIVRPLPGSPAERAGLLPGDVVTRIDGEPLDGLTLEEARNRVRGRKDTTVVLTVERGDTAPFEVEIVRAVIVSPEVETETLAGGAVEYLRLTGFSDHAAEQVDEAVTAAVGRGARGMILDLRGNPGGYVTAARAITSEFLAEGTIFWQEDADGALVETAVTPGGTATDPSIELVVLVDGGTASASEIVAGALRDNERATLVGTQTFGKGTVQQWTQLEDDHGGFRLTVAKWLTPDRTWVHGTGIAPDVEVTEQPEQPGDDPVLDAALELLGIEAGASR